MKTVSLMNAKNTASTMWYKNKAQYWSITFIILRVVKQCGVLRLKNRIKAKHFATIFFRTTKFAPRVVNSSRRFFCCPSVAHLRTRCACPDGTKKLLRRSGMHCSGQVLHNYTYCTHKRTWISSREFIWQHWRRCYCFLRQRVCCRIMW